MLAVANIAFLVLHTGLIAFNVFGWLLPSTRRWNLAAQLVTLGSWLGMGAFKGIGYCFCTDYHWAIRREMGIDDDPPTYIGFLFKTATGTVPSDDFIFWLTVSVFAISLVGSITLNVRDFRRRKAVAARPLGEISR